VDDLEADSVPVDDVAKIHTGIGVVIPASKLVETIMQPELLEERQRMTRETKV
jgi:hypothetical protein